MKNENEIRKAFETSKTYTEVSEKLGCKYSLANMKRYAKKYDICTKHFTQSRGQAVFRVCPVCETEFTVWKCEAKIYCSKRCANSLCLGERHSINTHKKISNALIGRASLKPKIIHTKICKTCNERFPSKTRNRIYCSQECRNKNPDYRKKLSVAIQQRIKDGKHQGWTSRNILSFPEKFFKNVFEQNGFKGKFVTNHPVKKRSLGIDCDSCYFLDFYFPHLKLDVEIDGKQHNRPNIKQHDEIRDMKLKANGYNVYRIQWKSLQNEKEYFKTEIEKILNILNENNFAASIYDLSV